MVGSPSGPSAREDIPLIDDFEVIMVEDIGGMDSISLSM
jgi:hypothetical protein